MNDEKLWEEIESCLKYDDNSNNCYNGEYPFLETTSIENLMDLFENKQTELLKEFVEWYKNVLMTDYDDKARWMADRRKEKDMNNYYSYHGECSAISRLITLLDNDLKKFLKENKDEVY